MVGLWNAARPAQWVKNLLLFAGLIFGGKLRDVHATITAFYAFLVFCALSSATYLINDVLDRESDRRHPAKQNRPIACGAVRPRVANGVSILLIVMAIAGAAAIDWSFAVVGAAYVALMVLYSSVLKHVVILDVLTIAGGFVLRALAGAVVVHVQFSHWLLILTLLLALFLALSKRRAELVGGPGGRGRRVLTQYSPVLLDQLIGVVTPSTVLAYAFYTISPETIARVGTDRLLLTLPFPLYGIFRYLYLIHQRGGGDNPSETLVSDPPLLACIALWAASVVAVLYGPWS